MCKCILPISHKCSYSTFHEQAFPIGIMEAHNIDTKKWIGTTHLELKYSDDELISPISGYFIKFNNGPFISSFFTIYANDLFYYPNIIISNICEIIQNEGYIRGVTNFYAIHTNDAYQKEDNIFNLCMYGFDINQKVLYCIGYTKNQVYEKYNISFDEFINSLKLIYEDKIEFEVLQMNPQYKYSFKWENVKKYISNYLLSKSECEESIYDNCTNFFYGKEAENEYIKYLKRIVKEKKEIDVRNGRSLKEYKSVIKYLLEIYPYTDSINIKNFLSIYEKYDLHQTLCIKYNIEKKENIVDRIINCLSSAFDEEYQLLNMFLSKL